MSIAAGINRFVDLKLAETRHQETLRTLRAGQATTDEVQELRRRLYAAKASAEGYRDLAGAIVDEIADIERGKRQKRLLSDPQNRDVRREYLNARENAHVRLISGGTITKINR